ncbi:SDR family oxidoreductase [Achromobacter sp. GG226]|uniref:SDR family oxidoreductase n=1 Tax=Verticiella alkaliphila TaxID=2779529 RepID=UPI001C0B9D95|nr:SDR family oxidoreductase [Verticiella sp. GG226]MBU4611313.1 SDR family oxidoreductase [Verticiella sp. GG226]
MSSSKPDTLPPQQQDRQPGIQSEMQPRPQGDGREYLAAGKLQGRTAVITGGDSGIGRAVAVLFAKEGADVLVAYLDEEEDAHETQRLVEATGRRCELIAGDLGDEAHAKAVAARARECFGKIDILVNNAAEQHTQQALEDITSAQLERTFRTNFFGMFNLTRELLPAIPSGGCIINTTSVTAYRGSAKLMDYASTKGAIVAFTRSLSSAVVERGIRVNAVAPGPIWTPLIPASFTPEEVAEFGQQVPMKRPGQPDEVGPCYVFLASDDASYMTGQVLHPNGGEVVNG